MSELGEKTERGYGYSPRCQDKREQPTPKCPSTPDLHSQGLTFFDHSVIPSILVSLFLLCSVEAEILWKTKWFVRSQLQVKVIHPTTDHLSSWVAEKLGIL